MTLLDATTADLTTDPSTDATALAERAGLEVRHLSGHIGSEVRGLDVRDLDSTTAEAIRSVLLERKVVFLPDQHLNPTEHIEFARHFGEPTEGHPVVPGVEGTPEVFEIDYTAANELYTAYGDVADRDRGIHWHTDVTFVERPPLGSILNAVVIPASGGDTLFSNQEAAFEALSPSFQDYLRTLRAVHDGTAQFQPILDLVGEGEWEGERFTALEPTSHPVVRVHPETGRESLFVNPGFTSHIEGLSRAESDTLLSFLYEQSVKNDFTVRYHWIAGTLGFWDNRATQHAVVGDFGDQPRVIQRVTLRGDRPVGA